LLFQPGKPTSIPERNALQEKQVGNVNPRPAAQPRPGAAQPQTKAAQPQTRATPSDEESEEELPRPPKRVTAHRPRYEGNSDDEQELDEQDEQEEETSQGYSCGFGQGDYRGRAGYPDWTPPRYPEDDEDQSQDVIEDQLPQNGTKRGRADSTEPDSHRGRKAQRVADGRPKAGNLEIEAKEIFNSAVRYYRARVSAKQPYPDPIQDATWAKEAWKEGCEINEVNIDHDPEILKLVRDNSHTIPVLTSPQITNRASQLRGEIKTHSKQAVRLAFGFVDTNNPDLIEKQKQRAKDLKNGYAYAYLVRISFKFRLVLIHAPNRTLMVPRRLVS
jgi:hypothetical protein